MLELLKVVVQTVVIERDQDGVIVGERISEPVALYSLDDVGRFVDRVRQQLAQEEHHAI